jgi:glycine oxidase
MPQADIAIAGAGIIGLSTALELASTGMRVIVFERGYAMRECSWAAAGMLAVADPENLSPLRPLSEFSRSLYPEFLASIERLSGKKIPIRTTQTLNGTHTLPSQAEALSAEAVQSIAPGLQHGDLNFFLLEEQSLDPRDLAQALPEAAKATGITLLEQTDVTAVTPHADSVQIQTSRGEWTAANFINACGAWASDLCSIPITPRKGQMLLVEIPLPTSQQLTIVLRTPDVYLVPRGNGRIVIGATVEDAGYDKQIDPAAISALYNAAVELWPPIRNARTLDTWAGLRPATSDSLPAIGIDGTFPENAAHKGQQSPRSWLATGHFRNGILLAPGTARLLRQMILKEPLSIDAAAFHPGRFTASLAR